MPAISLILLRDWTQHARSAPRDALVAFDNSIIKVPDISAASVIKYLKREDGLPSGQIQDLAQDRDGLLWIATPSGLANFDGSRVQVFAKNEGLQTHGLRAVDVAPDNRLWVGSDAGFDLLEDGKVVTSSAHQDWAHGFVECIHCTADTTWLGTFAGLVAHDGVTAQLASHPLLRGVLINALDSGSDGSVWAATANNDLLVREQGEWHQPESSEWREAGRILSIRHGPRDRVWLGCVDGFVEVSRSGQIVACQLDVQPDTKISAMLFFNGELWVAANKRLEVYRRSAGNWRFDRLVLDGHLINGIHADPFGNIWLATESHGIAKFSALNNVIRRVALGDPQAIFSIKPGRNPGELIAAGDRASWVIDKDRGNKAQEITELRERQVWDVLATSDGSLFAATANGLLHIDSENTKTTIGSDHPIVSRPNRCLIRHRGRVVVGTLGGCAAINDDLSIDAINADNDAAIGYVYTLCEDQSGRLWAGTLGNGLWLLGRDGFRRFEHPLLSQTGNTYAIDVRSDGLMTFVQDNKLFLLRAKDELQQLASSDEPIMGWTVRWADDGSIWTGSASGLTQYNSNDGRRKRQIISLIGLSEWEFTTSRSLHVGAGGAFYCGVNSGLLTVDSRRLADLVDVPSVKVASVDWKQAQPVRRNDIDVVTFGRWSVSVRVFAAWYVDEDDLQFRFRLLGHDEGWRPLDRRASLRLESLPPGEYQVEAQAFSRLVGFGPVETILKLRVLKPTWASKALLTPFAAVGRLWRVSEALLRNRSLNERNLELEREVQSRTADIEQAKMMLETVNRELASQSITDALTGISNRRHFDEQFAQALRDAAQSGQPISLALMDIDFFKPYNDIYGHAKGDDCLSFVARKLEAALYRSTDILARYGGEEFAVILPDVDAEGAMQLAERLRKDIELLAMEHRGSPDYQRLTISVGVTTLDNPIGLQIDESTATRLIESADAGLYRAKAQGRNQCVFMSAPDFGISV